MLNVYKVESDAQIPHYETRKSACFDISAYMPANEAITIFRNAGEKSEVRPSHDGENGKRYINLFPNERALIRTGLIFDIPPGYSMRLHSRSGMALKYGLVLGNGEGIIDEDYVLETKVIMINTSAESVKIYHGDRIAQGEVVSCLQMDIYETFEKPGQKTDRVGGFGSTGKS